MPRITNYSEKKKCVRLEFLNEDLKLDKYTVYSTVLEGTFDKLFPKADNEYLGKFVEVKNINIYKGEW